MCNRQSRLKEKSAKDGDLGVEGGGDRGKAETEVQKLEEVPQ